MASVTARTASRRSRTCIAAHPDECSSDPDASGSEGSKGIGPESTTERSDPVADATSSNGMFAASIHQTEIHLARETFLPNAGDRSMAAPAAISENGPRLTGGGLAFARERRGDDDDFSAHCGGSQQQGHAGAVGLQDRGAGVRVRDSPGALSVCLTKRASVQTTAIYRRP
jgi:hypothetical protein